MVKMKIAFFTMVGLLPIAAYSTIYADSANCPKQAIHCVFSNTANSAKWVEAVMQPKNITITLCMDSNTALYLEKDDVIMDKLKPDTVLTWQLSQCTDAACSTKISLGTDQFTLLKTGKLYSTAPANYAFTLNPNFGENCQFPLKKLMFNF